MSFNIFVVTYRVTNFLTKLVNMLSGEKNWISIFWIPIFSGIAVKSQSVLHRGSKGR